MTELEQDLHKSYTDTVNRQAAINAVMDELKRSPTSAIRAKTRLESLPAAQPPIDEWCYKCKEYDSDRNCCPRFDRIIGKALEDLQPQRMRGRWIYGSPVTMKCDQCGYFIADWRAAESNYCPSCGADMRGGEQDEQTD